MFKRNKKAQMGDAITSLITLITGVGVAVLVLIFVGALGGQTYNIIEDDINSIGNNTVTIYSFLMTNDSTQSLGNTLIHSGSLLIYNASGITIGLSNFTIDYTSGTARLIGGAINNASAVYNSTTGYANYTWGDLTVQSSVKSGIISGFSALEQTGNYMPIIVLAVVISLVLFLVLGMTGMATGKGGQNYAL